MSPEHLVAHRSCSKHQLGMVYSPYQCWRMLYTAEDALKHGTLFEELYKPLEER
ncbi:MAG: spore coat associated protein CotJA [Clostridia bacterium]|nr:spore coat associated protein CotJA [Clostridia bacterium]